jgi:hypothetical protein
MAVAVLRCRGMSVRPASHHVEGDVDILLGDLFRGERAVRPPPRRQRCAHGDDGAGGRVGVVGAEPPVCNLHYLLNTNRSSDRPHALMFTREET